MPTDEYRVGPGDALTVTMQCPSGIGICADEEQSGGTTTREATVSPTGDITLPLIGDIHVGGKTTDGIRGLIHKELSRYVRRFMVEVKIAKLRMMNVSVSGEATNTGSQILPSVCTASMAALQAGIKPTGSTRRVTLIRGEKREIVDVYRIAESADAGRDILLEPGDAIYIAPVTRFVEITGEVVRPGRYEMVRLSGEDGDFRVCDLLELAMGTLPTAASDRAFVERIGEDGRKAAISAGRDVALQPGDVMVMPSISAFQPIVRLVGEFRGDGVYQRAAGSTREDSQNKGGIYFLKQGQTLLDVISATGGVTPQADLKRAHIERTHDGVAREVPLDLERLLVDGDRSADVQLKNGDTIVLPASADKIHVFGEIKSPGSYAYSPNRRLIDYLGDAGGPTQSARLTEISVVRGDDDHPNIRRVDARMAIRRGNLDGNPVLAPGDIVYVPTKLVSDWRDAVQLIFTSLSLRSLLK